MMPASSPDPSCPSTAAVQHEVRTPKHAEPADRTGARERLTQLPEKKVDGVAIDEPAGGHAMTSERLELEPLHIEHAEEMAALLDDVSLHTYTGGGPATVDALRERYRRQIVGRSPDGSQLWLNWVLRRRDTGQAVGTVQATVSSKTHGLTAEVAWVVGAPYQRQGYAKEAAQAIATWLRQQGIGNLTAHVHPRHSASIGVARAIGLEATDVIIDGETRWQG